MTFTATLPARPFLSTLCILSLLLGLAGPTSQASDKEPRYRSGDPSATVDDVIPGMLFVKFKNYVQTGNKAAQSGIASFDARLQALGAVEIEAPFEYARTMAAAKGGTSEALDNVLRIRRIRYDRPLTPMAAAALLSMDPSVEYAEPVYKRKLARVDASAMPGGSQLSSTMATPNDPQYANQTHLALVQAPEAWDLVKGEGNNIVIGVIDGGTDWNHEDLRANIWTNPNETDANGVDDDNNGFVDDIRGWDFGENEADPTGNVATPTNAAHGTQTSSMFGAVTNNSTGIAGMAWNVDIMPIAVGCADTDNAICHSTEGLMYAVMNGADIINASYGSPFFSSADLDVVALAREMDVLIVAAAGNDNQVNDITPHYPSNYEGVLSVGSTQKDDDFIGAFSNIGLSVDVFAPGVFVEATDPDNGYSDNNNGTSYSAPLVAGIAALVRIQNPDWTYEEVAEQIRVTAEDMTEKNNSARTRDRLGKGRVNALRALTVNNLPSLRLSDLTLEDENGNGFLQRNERIETSLTFFNHLADANNVSVTLRSADPIISIEPATQTLASITSKGEGTVSFGVTVVSGSVEDYPVELIADIETAEYTDKVRVRFVVNRVTHSAGSFELGLPPEGNVGVSGFGLDSLKAGFLFPILGMERSFARNVLFEGGIMIGAGGNVSDQIRGGADDEADQDFVQDYTKALGLISITPEFEMGLSVYNDTGAPNPIGVKVHQETYTSNNTDSIGFAILRYVITNTNESASIDDLYAALFLDWDILSTLADFYSPRPTFPFDNVRFDTDRRMSYAYDLPSDAFVHLGSKLLTSNADLMYRSIDNPEEIYGGTAGDGFTDQEKWDWISGGIQRNNLNQVDLSTMLGAGPVALAPGETFEIAFSLFGGFSLEELQFLADQSQQYWDERISTSQPTPVSTETAESSLSFELDPAYPNPFSSQTTIRFQLPEPGAVTLEVFDVLGRRVRTLAAGTRPAGRHAVVFDGRSDEGHTLANGMYLYRLIGPGENGERIASHQLMLVR